MTLCVFHHNEDHTAIVGVVGHDAWDDSRVGNLVFLSARPHVYKDLSESVSFEKFRYLQETRGLYTAPSLLAGNLDTGSKFMLGGFMEPIALKKYMNFCEYLSLYPEFQCIFIGDNGQGDVRTGILVEVLVHYAFMMLTLDLL
jgi:hypothetical protein